jgi:hypothetical protein
LKIGQPYLETVPETATGCFLSLVIVLGTNTPLESSPIGRRGYEQHHGIGIDLKKKQKERVI